MVIDWRFDESCKFKGEFEKKGKNHAIVTETGTVSGVVWCSKKGKMWKWKMNSWRLSVDNVDDDMGVWV